MLEIRNLSKTYPGGVQALRNVSLVIEPGMYGLLGPNGAGKTTLMKCLATLLDPDAGSITFDGHDLLVEKEEVRRMLGYLPQDFGLYPTLSAEQMLDYLATMKGIALPSERRRVVGALLERVNLASVKKRRLGGFSGGMKQRFGIAQALLGSPKLLVVDEPTAGLDPEERHRFQNLLAELAGDIVILLSTHIVSDVTSLCRRFAIIKNGLILLQATPAEAVEVMRGKVWEKTVPRSLVERYRARMAVISTMPCVDGIRMRVLAAEGHPGDELAAGTTFEPVEPTLEDVYFCYINEPAPEGGVLSSSSSSIQVELRP
jgi:ABC-2 type transport system ATP-binding protein